MIKKTESEIRQLLESQTLEVKKALSLMREGVVALNSMVNTDEGLGRIVFGIDPDGTVCGVEPGNLDKAQISIAQHIQSKFEPTLHCQIEVWDCEGKSLIVVAGRRAQACPYHEYNGRAFIREGSMSRQLSLVEKQNLFKRRNRDQHNGPWKCDRCGSIAGMLSAITVSDQGVRKSYNCRCGGEWWPAT